MIRGVAGVWLIHLTWWSLKLSAKSWSLCGWLVVSEPDESGASLRRLVVQSVPCKNEKMECKHYPGLCGKRTTLWCMQGYVIITSLFLVVLCMCKWVSTSVPHVTRSCPRGCQTIHSNPACLVVKTPQLATRMTTYGKLSQFIPEAECVAGYLERVELFSTANTIPGSVFEHCQRENISPTVGLKPQRSRRTSR